MSKGIAVSTVLKFLLGLLVLVIVAFLVYRIFYAPPLTEQECRMRMTSWCSTCDLLGWPTEDENPNSVMDSRLADCASKYFDIKTTACNDTVSDCGNFLP